MTNWKQRTDPIYIIYIFLLLSVAVHNINTSFDSVNRAKIRIARLSFVNLSCLNIDLNDLQEALPENYIYDIRKHIYQPINQSNSQFNMQFVIVHFKPRSEAQRDIHTHIQLAYSKYIQIYIHIYLNGTVAETANGDPMVFSIQF